MLIANNCIWITFQKEGIHAYPAALTDPKLKDVAFLGNPHRHIFHFRVWLEVFHDDRDVEFILFKRELEALYQSSGPYTTDFQSCEMLARELIMYVREHYTGREVAVEVSEDGENGAIVRYNPRD